MRAAVVSLLVLALSGCLDREAQTQRYLDRAEGFLAQGLLDKASVDARNALQTDEGSAQAHFVFAQVLAAQQNWRQMAAHLVQSVDLDPYHVDAQIKLGTLYLANGAVGQAEESARTAVGLEPGNATARALLAVVLHRQGRQQEAEAESQRAIQLDPANVSAIASVRHVYPESEMDYILATLERGQKEGADREQLRLLHLGILEQTGAEDEALELFRQLVEEHPDKTTYAHQYVAFLERVGRQSAAEAFLEENVAKHPGDAPRILWLAQYLQNQERTDEALALLERSAAAHPQSPELGIALGRAYAAVGRKAEARAAFGRIASDDEAFLTQARIEIATIDLQGGDVDQARAALEDLSEADRGTASARLLAARLADDDGRLADAASELRGVLRLEPTSKEALLLLAEVHTKSGATNLAEDTYAQLLEFHPRSGLALLGQARQLLSRNRPEDAIRMSKVVVSNPQLVAQALQVLSLAHAQLGQFEEAREYAAALQEQVGFAEAGQLLKGDIQQAEGDTAAAMRSYDAVSGSDQARIQALLRQAQLRMSQGELQIAEDALRQNQSLGPEVTELLAVVLVQRGQPAEAIRLLSSVSCSHPDRTQPYALLSDLYFQQQQLPEARRVLDEGLAELPTAGVLLIRAADTAAIAGDYAAAVSYYERLLDEEAHPVAANNLAMIVADHLPTPEQLAKAQKHLRRYESSSEPALRDTIGWVYLKSNDVEQALAHLEWVLESGASSPETHYHLGLAYQAADRFAEAERSLALAVEGGAGSHWLAEARASLEDVRGR